LANITVIGGRPDANLDDLRRVDLVVRDGCLVIEHGQSVIPRQVPASMPEPEQAGHSIGRN
jgi:hypothetical protein